MHAESEPGDKWDLSLPVPVRNAFLFRLVEALFTTLSQPVPSIGKESLPAARETAKSPPSKESGSVENLLIEFQTNPFPDVQAGSVLQKQM